MRTLLSTTAIVTAIAGLTAAPALASRAPAAARDVGTLSVCNTSGNPPISLALAFTQTAPGGAGGTVVQTASVGTCTAPVFYTVGTQVLVTENVPTGFAVTSITVGGGQSTLSQTIPAAGAANVTIGTGNSVLTFVTRGPGAPAPAPCVVPNVTGLTLAAARKAARANRCRVGSVIYVYSARIPKGGVTRVRPAQGTRLAHNAKIRLYVSRGRKP
jgi:PASTA domain